MKLWWEKVVLDAMEKEPAGLFSRSLRGGLKLLSYGYRTGVSVRNFAHDRGLLTTFTPPVPVVVSIGNIVAGGTGKTPVTLLLAEELAEKYSVALLCRGYRSPAEKRDIPLILSRGDGPEYSAAYCGDEPYLLAKRVKKAAVFVGKNRIRASILAAQHGAEIILLDDGMQHRKLARDFEIVVVDAHDPFGKGDFLPRGLLRECPTALNKGDVVVVNNVASIEHLDSVKRRLRSYTSAPIVATAPEVSSIESSCGLGVPTLSGAKVGLFSGIANPKRFRALAEQQGARIVAELNSPDHTLPSVKALKNFALHAQKRGAKFLLCTEKDRVKVETGFECALPIASLNIRLKIISGSTEWNQLIDNIKKRVTTK